MLDTVPKKYAHQLWLIRGLTSQQVPGMAQQAKKDIKRAYRYDKENAIKFLD